MKQIGLKLLKTGAIPAKQAEEKSMRKGLVIVSLILASIITGFLWAGFLGAGLFAFFNTTTSFLFLKSKSLFNLLLMYFFFFGIGYGLMKFCGLLDAHELVHEKLATIRTHLIKKGHQPTWFIISQKRNSFFNDLLINSVKNGKSKHLEGKAIDIFVIDINQDGVYNLADFRILEQVEKECEQMNPKTKGKVVHYFGKGYFSQHMVHIQIDTGF